jgi:two-component system response regulator (stage 0 sporulation protein A)
VFRALDGEQAVQMVLDHKPDLVLLDLLLPKLDGFKVLERIRNYPEKSIAETKVIVLSNLWSDKDILRAQALKIDEYYVKANTNLDDVFKKISQIMGNITAA